MIKTKRDLFAYLKDNQISDPVLKTGDDGSMWSLPNMWFIVKSKSDFSKRGVELPGCRLMERTNEKIISYNQRENSLVEKYNRWISEYKSELAKNRKE